MCFRKREYDELDRKLLVKKTIKNIQNQIDQLNNQKEMFVTAANSAKEKGMQSQYETAITGLKITLLQEKKANELLLNFQIANQIKDVTQMTIEFLKGMSDLSKQMIDISKCMEFKSIEKDFQEAMREIKNKSTLMDDFSDKTLEIFKNQLPTNTLYLDNEIQTLLNSSKIDLNDYDKQIDEELNKIQQRLEK